MVGVDDLDRLVVEDVGRGHDATTVALDADRARLLGVVLDHESFDVQHEIGDILDHAGDRGELVLHALDLDLGDGASLQARQEDAPQAVADGVAESAFEWLDVELALRIGQLLAVTYHPAGKFEATPTDAHRSLQWVAGGRVEPSKGSGSRGGAGVGKPAARPHPADDRQPIRPARDEESSWAFYDNALRVSNSTIKRAGTGNEI